MRSNIRLASANRGCYVYCVFLILLTTSVCYCQGLPAPDQHKTTETSSDIKSGSHNGTQDVGSTRTVLNEDNDDLKLFLWAFAGCEGILLCSLVGGLAYSSWHGSWSLSEALSEESAYQPAQIRTKNDLILLPSSSRLIAFAGLAVLVPVVIGTTIIVLLRLVLTGSIPDLSGISKFLSAAALIFAPYLANQVRSAFDPPFRAQASTPIIPGPNQPGPPLSPWKPTAGMASPDRDTTLIDDVPSLNLYRKSLRSRGYRTTDHLVGVAYGAEKELASYLGVDRKKLHQLIKRIPRSKSLDSFASGPLRKYPFGARLDQIKPVTKAPVMSGLSGGSLLDTVNWISQMPPIGDQGPMRQTCVAFAVSAIVEHFEGLTGQYVELSEQFLYWACKENDGDSTGAGTHIGIAMTLLQSTGCCLENTWPYNPQAESGNEAEAPPPDGATDEASQYRIPGYKQLSPTSVLDIKSELTADRCVAFTIPVFGSSYRNPDVIRTGEFVNPVDGELILGAHSMCFVGYGDDATDTASGGGKFFVRNSWENWAPESILGTAGYGTIPYSYIARFGAEAYCVDLT